MRLLVPISVTLLFALSCTTSKTATSPSSPASNDSSGNGYSSVITDDEISSSGVLDVHYVDDKIYYEIPDSLLGRDFLMVSRVAAVPNNFFGFISSGSKTAEQVIVFEKVRHVMTYEATNPPSASNTNTISLLMNQSMVLLPKEPMRPRHYDYRVGWFTINQLDFGLDEQKAGTRSLIRRWRLEPSDPDAYFRGELVEPVKPIIYYVDPGTPEEYRQAVIKGVEDWNETFEVAGFKNAIQAKLPPTHEEDPNFEPEDIRYNMVRWIANTTRNAVGPSTTDPRLLRDELQTLDQQVGRALGRSNNRMTQVHLSDVKERINQILDPA